MRRALLISRAPADGLALAVRLAEAGDEVRALLLDGAVAVARRGHADHRALTAAVKAGVIVSAHDDALRQRAIAEPVETVKAIDLEEVADIVTDGADRVVWT